MFTDIASQLIKSNQSKMDLQTMDEHGFKITENSEDSEESCIC